MKINKKAQVTIFIIVAILLLFSAALVIYIKERVSEPVEAEIPEVIEEVPTMTIPVKNFIDACIKQVGENGLKQIGLHGGYIDTSPAGYNYTQLGFNIDFSGIMPTEFEAFKYATDVEWYIPYWYYMKSKNDLSEPVQLASSIPVMKRNSPVSRENKGDETNSIEMQLDRYVKANLMECFANFATFTEQGYEIEPKGEPSVTTQIGKSVIIYLEYPLEVKKENAKATVSQFRQDIDVDLPNIYNFAYDLLNGVRKYRSFDQFTRNTISAYGRLEGEIPPMAAVEVFKSTPEIWLESKVKQEIESVFEYNIPKVKVKGTRNFIHYKFLVNPRDRIKWGTHLDYVIDLNKTYPNLVVDFRYSKDWPIYFDVVPGEMISAYQSSVGDDILAFLGVHRYATPYDVSVPILVQITDQDALDGEGYTFMFGIESNMRNNEIINESYEPLRQPTPTAEEIGEAHLCDYNQRNSGEITIETRDMLGNPLPEVGVTFISGEECPIGHTKLENGKATMTSKFPVGLGSIELVHVNTLPLRFMYSTKVDQGDRIEVELPTLVFKNAVMKKYELVKDLSLTMSQIRNIKTDPIEQWLINWRLKELEKSETVIVQFNKIKEGNFDSDYQTVGLFQGDKPAKLRLVPGRYDLTIITVVNDTIVIPECKDCICVETYLVGDRCKKHQDIEGATFNGSFFGGTYEMKNVSFSPQKLYNNDTLNFRVLVLDMVDLVEERRMIKDLKMLSYMQNITQGRLVRDKLLPR